MALKQIHLRFKQIRTTLGLNQINYSTLTKLKQSQVSQVETGARDISESMFDLLEQNLKVNRVWLSEGIGEMFIAGSKPEDIKVVAKELVDNIDTTSVTKRRNTVYHAERLKFFRQQEKISGDQLASELGITTPNLRKYESGALSIPIAAIVYLHTKYHMRYDWFLDGTGNRKTTPGERSHPDISIEDMQETQTVLIAKIDYLEKQLNQERAARKKMQKDINNLSIQIA